MTGRARPPLPLLIGFTVFLMAIVYLIAVSMTPRDVPTFELTPLVELASHDAGDAGLVLSRSTDAESVAAPRLDTITIDAGNAETWRYFSFRRRALLQAPDTLEWDLAVRRYHLRTAGMAADLGPPGEGDASTSDASFLADDGRDDSGHPAMRRWYRYGMFTHLLESKRHSYLVRTRDGRLARIEVLSYYCPGPRPGCMTLRYAYPLR